jgi:hypothetical protein
MNNKTEYKILQAKAPQGIGLTVGVYNINKEQNPFLAEPTKYSDKSHNEQASKNLATMEKADYNREGRQPKEVEKVQRNMKKIIKG